MTCKHPMFVQPVCTACRNLFVPVYVVMYNVCRWLNAFNDIPLVAYHEREGLDVKSISWKCKHFPLLTHAQTNVILYTVLNLAVELQIAILTHWWDLIWQFGTGSPYMR